VYTHHLVVAFEIQRSKSKCLTVIAFVTHTFVVLGQIIGLKHLTHTVTYTADKNTSLPVDDYITAGNFETEDALYSYNFQHDCDEIRQETQRSKRPFDGTAQRQLAKDCEYYGKGAVSCTFDGENDDELTVRLSNPS